MRRSIMFLCSASLLCVSARASAQDPKFAHGSEEDRTELEKTEDTEWKTDAQAGLILTTGNSRSTSLSIGSKASRKANKNKFQLEAGGAYIRSSILLADDAAMGTSGQVSFPGSRQRPRSRGNSRLATTAF